MEAGLKKLETQEQKYSVELDKALTEYANLKAQAANFDLVELYKVRNAIRPVQEKEAEQQLEDTMHEKPSLIMLLSAKQEASRLLGEDARIGRRGRWLCSGRKNREQFRRISSRKKSIGRDNVRRRLHRSSRRLSYSISCSRSAKRFDAKNS